MEAIFFSEKRALIVFAWVIDVWLSCLPAKAPSGFGKIKIIEIQSMVQSHSGTQNIIVDWLSPAEEFDPIPSGNQRFITGFLVQV